MATEEKRVINVHMPLQLYNALNKMRKETGVSLTELMKRSAAATLATYKNTGETPKPADV